MIHSGDLNFSFSGLKTAVLYYLRSLKNPSREQLSECDWREKEGIFQQKNTPFARENGFSDLEKSAVAREFEDAVIETLVSKTKKAIEIYSPKTLIIGGGVIANKALREHFLNLKNSYPDLQILIPEKSLTTDNATMIAAAGYIEHLRKKGKVELKADGNLEIS
jgi:N6-L-threonylcarbamoyladenine synthase